MTTRQLGDIVYSYGETTLGGKKAIAVVTADEAGGRLSIRPLKAQKSVASRRSGSA